MSPAELEAYLRTRIPLSQAMQVRVDSLGAAGLRLSAPLAPNINHRDTVFGGSAAAVAMLAAWGLLYVLLAKAATDARLVIQHCDMRFLKPIEADFEATSSIDDPADWHRFVGAIRRKGRARIAVNVALDCRGVRVGEFIGEFVALRMQPADSTAAEAL